MGKSEQVGEKLSKDTTLLKVEKIQVCDNSLRFKIIDDVSFDLQRGQTFGIVGESGSGKTTVAMTLLGFNREGTKITSGSVCIDGENLLSLPTKVLSSYRGKKIAYVPQDPSTGLNPNMRISESLREMLAVHVSDERDLNNRIAEVLEMTQLPSDLAFQRRYPFELSGGQQQRVAIALALICRPKIIVMDEPTTGLDVTTQSKLILVIKKLIQDTNTALVYVSHDLGVVRSIVNQVAVMYGGRIVEQGKVSDVFSRPAHPYTRGLLEAVPRATARAYRPKAIPGSAVEPWDLPSGCPFTPRCSFKSSDCDSKMPPVELLGDNRMVRCFNLTEASKYKPNLIVLERKELEETESRLKNVKLEVIEISAGYKTFRWYRDSSHNDAITAVSFSVSSGNCVAIVGESGSGKTTTLRCIAGLHKPKSGIIRFDHLIVGNTSRLRSLETRRRIQMIPQNPDSSLNPHRCIGDIIGRPIDLYFKLSTRQKAEKIEQLLDRVHLKTNILSRYSRELSGGEKQRVAIARALAAEPELLLCDEVVSSLDVAVQAGILELLQELQIKMGMTLIFVSHDLGVVRSIASEVIVMKKGMVVESNLTHRIFETPQQPYTLELLNAIPNLGESDYPGEPHK